jgi:hypothetical protein
MNVKDIFMKYPYVADLLAKDPQAFMKYLDELMSLGNTMLKQEESGKPFTISTIEACNLFIEVFFNPGMIAKQHPNKEIGEAFATMEKELHPLNAFLGKSKTYDFKGNHISHNQFTNANTVKEFFQSYLFNLRFMNIADLTKAFMLDNSDLIDSTRYGNIKELILIQPALQYQMKHNLQPLKYIEDTGFFNCGSTEEIICPSCKADTLKEFGTFKGCMNCKGGFALM